MIVRIKFPLLRDPANGTNTWISMTGLINARIQIVTKCKVSPTQGDFSVTSASSGKGFTRHENLKEHLRRLHRGGDGRSPEAPLTSEISEPENGTTSLTSPLHPPKRKRDDSESASSSDEGRPNGTHSLREEVTRLRREAQLKDSRLDELEKEVKQLRQMIQKC
ncbi:hypothetical protein FQN55_000264 [Onygenales sp. PD_40]|nr:hypothetical protein FQN55_000264 [Onygenales sp. PD_40]